MLEGCESSPDPAAIPRSPDRGPIEGPPNPSGSSPCSPFFHGLATVAPLMAGESVRLLALLAGRGAEDVSPDDYERHLHAPMRALLARVRTGYVQPLDPEVAAGRRQLSAFRKGGFGKGRCHDHLGFAFYDPAVS